MLVEWRGTDALVFDTLQLRVDRAAGIASPSTMTGVKSQASLPNSELESGSARGSDRESDRQLLEEVQPEGSPGIGGYDASPRRIPPRYTRFARMTELTQ